MPTMAPFDSIEEFLRCRPGGQACELSGKILLQRLSLPLGPLLERRVNVFGNVAYEKVCHAFIMIAPAPGWPISPEMPSL